MSVTNFVHKNWYVFCSKVKLYKRWIGLLYKMVLLQSTDTYSTILHFLWPSSILHTIWHFNTKINKNASRNKVSIFHHPCFKANTGGGHSYGVWLISSFMHIQHKL
jgi:hypothetical protein